jgi:hypothetical protein
LSRSSLCRSGCPLFAGPPPKEISASRAIPELCVHIRLQHNDPIQPMCAWRCHVQIQYPGNEERVVARKRLDRCYLWCCRACWSPCPKQTTGLWVGHMSPQEDDRRYSAAHPTRRRHVQTPK